MSANKRPRNGDDCGYQYRQQKRQHHDNRDVYDSNAYDGSGGTSRHHGERMDKSRDDRQPSPLPFPLPALPAISSEYSTAPFTHRSTVNESRTVANSFRSTAGAKHVSYERLEFLGDAYIEEFASEVIFDRFQHLSAGQMSQLRELLVKNETLADYSRAYGFDQRLTVSDLDQMRSDAHKRNKGYFKVLGDVFEAYIAAIVLSHVDREKGKAIARQWLLNLWGPKLAEAVSRDRIYNPDMILANAASTNPAHVYNTDAKALLQKRIMKGTNVKLSYEKWKDSVELKGDKLGQNRHFVALYLTGYGYEKKLLGKAEGKNKVEAGNWCAIQAMYGDGKAIVDECERTAQSEKEERMKSKEIKEHRETDRPESEAQIVGDVVADG